MRLALLALPITLAIAGVSFADPPANSPHHGQRPGLEAADANGDGTISRAEFDAARTARFAQMDANRDGVIDAAERANSPGPGQRRFNPDANNDGRVSLTEFRAQSETMFNRLDANDDGALSEAELQRMQRHRRG